MEEKIKTSRLLFIHEQINMGHCYNAEQLAHQCNVSSRTIQRDIKYMKEEWHAPIKTKGMNKGYYYTEEFLGVPSMMMSEGELVSILVLEKMLPAYRNTPFAEYLLEIRRKLVELLPKKISVQKNNITEHISFLHSPLSVLEIKIWDVLLEAVEYHRKVRIAYTSLATLAKKTNPITRVIHPLHIFGSNGTWYVLAYDTHSNEERIFSLSRIKKITLEKTNFEAQKYNIEKNIDSYWGVFNNEAEIEVELAYSDYIAPLIEEKVWHPSQE